MAGDLIRRAFAFLLLSLVLAACSQTEPQQGRLPRGTLEVTTDSGTVDLKVEIAANGRARSVGLMNRPRLGQDSGMVFLFGTPTSSSFWMKDTLIPLSIAFWDRSGRILRVLDMEPCRADPCPFYYPEVTYVGAVEANLGWFADHGVGTGHRVKLVDD